MHVPTVLQRVGNVEPVTLNVLSTIWGRLKGKGGSTFGRLTTNLFGEPPTVVAYGEMAKKKAKKKAMAYGVKVKGILAFAPEGSTTARAVWRLPRTSSSFQLRGSKELLMHPPTPSMPGCPADIFGGAAGPPTRAGCGVPSLFNFLFAIPHRG